MTLRDLREVVAAKRDGHHLPAEDIQALVNAYVTDRIHDDLMAAFLMAAFLRGLDEEETLALTHACLRSGRTISLDRVDRPTVDKHSTGGVADGVTLVLAPLAAALGLAVAKLSGRGLGHTGGTVDKLEAIPGMRTDLSPEEVVEQVAALGCAIAAQSPEIVPADGRLYALRDATATVESIPLIAASVMSKKLAVGSDLVLLDVKSGSGAFTKTREDAVRLALACSSIGDRSGRRVRACVTDMSQPLGAAIGNGLEVAEAVEVLSGRRAGPIAELAVLLAGAALQQLAGEPAAQAARRAERALTDGSALGSFAAMVEAQGGDPRVVDDPGAVLPRAPVHLEVTAAADAWVAGADPEALGRTSRDLGAGRARKGDPIDPAVGLVVHAHVGDRVAAGQVVAEVHARDEAAARRASHAIGSALTYAERPVDPPPLVFEWVDRGERWKT